MNNISSQQNNIVSGNCEDDSDKTRSCDAPSILKNLKIKNINRLV